MNFSDNLSIASGAMYAGIKKDSTLFLMLYVFVKARRLPKIGSMSSSVPALILGCANEIPEVCIVASFWRGSRASYRTVSKRIQKLRE